VGAAGLEVTETESSLREESASAAALRQLMWPCMQRQEGAARKALGEGGSLAFGKAVEQRVLKGQLLLAPPHPKGIPAWKVYSNPHPTLSGPLSK
jgi:hypothetical protein